MIRAVHAVAAATLAITLAAGCHAPVQTSEQPTQTPQSVPAVQPLTADGAAFRNRSSHSNKSASGTAGVFDFYLLTLSWSPEYCVSHQGAAECAAHPTFVLHGLWPENSDGSYPENCSNAPGPADPGQYSDIYPDQGLLQHEWSTHGTCSGLAPDAYFKAERQAFQSVHTPPQLASLTRQISLTPNQILTDFTQANPSVLSGDEVLACGSNRLTALEVCLTKDLQATSCGSVKTCHANSVKITPPGATSDQ